MVCLRLRHGFAGARACVPLTGEENMPGLRLLALAVALLAAWAGAGESATAQVARVDRLEVVDHGLFQLRTGERTAAPGTATGWATAASAATLLERTDRVPARRGVAFGVRYIVAGSDTGIGVSLTVTWRFPEPGLKNPATGNVYRQQTTEIDARVGMPGASLYILEEDWEFLPGTWVVEV